MFGLYVRSCYKNTTIGDSRIAFYTRLEKWNLIPDHLKKVRDWKSFKLRVKLELKCNNTNFPE